MAVESKIMRGCCDVFDVSAHYPYEQNVGDYLVELGTYLPLRKQLEDLKRAGVDLRAQREANSLYQAGETIDLTQEYVDPLQVDEFDLDAKRELYYRMIVEQEQARKSERKRREAEFAEFQKQKAQESAKKSVDTTEVDSQ
ncbi:hypothetical protein [Alces alces faeces associated microvirus MP15 5067]|uniref:hypothetical protein n=1 Tax=Alces alces faeces associated microvirus MP15 5067 TaxID=2219136 RepID=UPI000DF0C076|nr:hypothetical protein [Alces alces faeces associated microvirus MP15 5067]AXB22579.1 hypothetical protein [Alces alces faeces associated microvirus MP15 5067]